MAVLLLIEINLFSRDSDWLTVLFMILRGRMDC